MHTYFLWVPDPEAHLQVDLNEPVCALGCQLTLLSPDKLEGFSMPWAGVWKQGNGQGPPQAQVRTCRQCQALTLAQYLTLSWHRFPKHSLPPPIAMQMVRFVQAPGTKLLWPQACFA